MRRQYNLFDFFINLISILKNGGLNRERRMRFRNQKSARCFFDRCPFVNEFLNIVNRRGLSPKSVKFMEFYGSDVLKRFIYLD